MTRAARGITLLAALLALLGISAGTTPVFASEQLSRAEAVALLVSSSPNARTAVDGLRSSMPPVALFSDIRQNQWFAPYLEAAFRAKLIRGNPDGTFRPGSVLTSEDAAILLSRAWQQESPLLYVPGPNPDVQYVPTLQEVAAAYGMHTPVGSTALPRDEYVYLLELLYGGDAVASIDPAAMQWAGRSMVASVTPSLPYVFDEEQRQEDEVPSEEIAEDEAPNDADEPEFIAEEPEVIVEDDAPLEVEHIDLPPAPVREPVIEHHVPTTNFVADASAIAPNENFTISLPSLGISALNITHPSDPFTHQGLLAPLKDGVGHLFSYPGRGGKILVYGHSSSYPWDVSAFTKIFRRINELQIGDRVAVTFEGRNFNYIVRDKKAVPAKDLTSYQNDGDGEELILYTCWPPDSITQRYLVIATPESEVANAW